MSTQELKLNITGLLKEVENTTILQQIRDLLLKEREKSEIIGYTPTGETLTKASYQNEVNEAIERIDAGEFISQEELLKESQNW